MLWDLFTVSALNVAGDDANLSLAATVVRTALLGARDAADIGTPAIPLGDLHGQAAGRLLDQLGASVRLGAKVTAVRPLAGGGFRVDWPTGAPGPAEVIAGRPGSCWPCRRGRRPGCCPPARRRGRPGPERWRELGASPIVNVHVLYDRQVTRLPFAAAVDSPVQWVFDRTGPSGLGAGQYLAVSVSAADDVVDTPAAQLRERFVPALEEIFPAARDARITDFFVTRERRATFRQEPGLWREAAGSHDQAGWPGARGRVDRYRVARHDGGCRAKRTDRSARAAARGGPITPVAPWPRRAAEVAGASS